LFQVPAFFPQRSRRPVQIAETVEDRAPDSHLRVGLEFDVALRFELIDGIKQADDARIDEILQFDIAGQSSSDSMRNVFDERKGLIDESLPFGWCHTTASAGSTY